MVIFFFNCSKFNINFKNVAKSWGIFFYFWDKCIWIGIVKLSLLKTGYFPSPANVFTSSPKIFLLNKWDFFQINWLSSDQGIWQRCCDTDFTSAWARVICCLSKVHLKRDFLDIYLTTFLDSVNSEIQKLRGSIFVSKFLKLNVDLKPAAKKSEKEFFYSDNLIRIGIVKLSLFRSGYFSSAANVLTSSTMIWHVNRRALFQLNILSSDQWLG